MVIQMSDFFKSVKQGLTEAIEHSEGKCPKAVVHEFSSVDVKRGKERDSVRNENQYQTRLSPPPFSL